MTWTCLPEIHMTLKLPLLCWDSTEIMSIGMILTNSHSWTLRAHNWLVQWTQLPVPSSSTHVSKGTSSCLLVVSQINHHWTLFTKHTWTSISASSREPSRSRFSQSLRVHCSFTQKLRDPSERQPRTSTTNSMFVILPMCSKVSCKLNKRLS